MTQRTERPINTHTHTGTWLGQPATSTTYARVKNVKSYTGLRVNVFVADRTPTRAEVRLIEGDGRYAGFVTHESLTVPVAEAEATARRLLGDDESEA